ncbi:MAG: purine-binding chemotaxis protein CheW [Deltaproteobacteria bacterium]|nr:purine-binding chemotaxis protein CheW [Deltaproteobacteria bacterium]
MTFPERIVPFSVEGLRLALPLEKVERVIPACAVTPLPEAPAAVLGVIDLGGQVIPVFDLRRRFGLPEKELVPEDRMLIARSSKRTVAMVADEAGSVIEAGPATIAAPGEVLPNMPHVRGVVKTAKGMIIIQDIDSFLSIEEEEVLESALKAKRKDGQKAP